MLAPASGARCRPGDSAMAKKARKKVAAKANKPAKRATKRRGAVAKSRRKAATAKKAKPVAKKAKPIVKQAKPVAEKPIVAPQAAPQPQSFVKRVEQKIEGAVAAVIDTLTDAERLHHKLDPGVPPIPE